MSRIRRRDTRIEFVLRRGLHKLGFRFRVDDGRLPGRPDLLFPKWRAALFVHGCFWHGHNCSLFRLPETRAEFWASKIERNRARDVSSVEKLRQLEWRVGTIWECALRGRGRIGEDAVLSECAAWLKSENPLLEVRGTC
jgi:DNA mismatch endonuclease (patch repair protein)